MKHRIEVKSTDESTKTWSLSIDGDGDLVINCDGISVAFVDTSGRIWMYDLAAKIAGLPCDADGAWEVG